MTDRILGADCGSGIDFFCIPQVIDLTGSPCSFHSKANTQHSINGEQNSIKPPGIPGLQKSPSPDRSRDMGVS